LLSFLVSTVLPENLDLSRSVSSDDDVAVEMSGALDICRRFLGTFVAVQRIAIVIL
jgi:hypothetical protein